MTIALQRNTVCRGTGSDPLRMADGSAAELKYHIFTEVIQQLVHLARVNAA